MKVKKKKLPVGIENFELLRKEDFYYVDKTGLIVELMNNWCKANLFTRPRRFGKTLNMSMLKSFLEIGGDKSIFDGLAVSRDTELCEKYMGRFPVVFLTLKGVDGLTFEEAYEQLKNLIREECHRLRFLKDSLQLDEYDKRILRRILEGEESAYDITFSLKMLSSLLEKHYGQKAIILIDEYDVPLDKAYQHGYYDRMLDLIRAMFGAALKTNDSLFFAVLTGYLCISRESIFTGFNNLKMHSISDARYDEYFGFTDQEVGEMLAYYGLEEFHEKAREWYDGYLFGNQDVYCPWDVINYCADLCSAPGAEPKAYWLNTSGNDMVRKLIDKTSNGTTQMEVEELIAGNTVTKQLDEQLTHNEIDKSVNNLWSLLYMTGYLTAARRPSWGRYTLRIPNQGVRQIFTRQVLEWFRDKTEAETGKLTELYAAFEKGDTETITDYLNEQLLYTVSFYDTRESFYHGFLLALLNTCTDWRVSSNAESGRGRSDIIAERKDRTLGFVVEVKDVKEEKMLDGACEAAVRQIEEKDYTATLRRCHVKEIWIYGIAFWEKESRVMAKRVA